MRISTNWQTVGLVLALGLHGAGGCVMEEEPGDEGSSGLDAASDAGSPSDAEPPDGLAADAELDSALSPDGGEGDASGNPDGVDADADTAVGDAGAPDSASACPTAVATCSIRGSGELPVTELLVTPLDVLECTAAGSSDPDGTIAGYRWSVGSAPEGSAGTFALPENAESTFFVDISGPYTLQLDVVDDTGVTSCSPATVAVQALYDEDISVQLTWTTAGDPIDDDAGPGAGSDLDLHFLHTGRGCWADERWDCHWRNKTPDWGAPGDNADDPAMERDSVDSSGHENVILNNPEPTTYRVGVNYYDGLGPAVATVRIFLFGSLVIERRRELTPENRFWDVAEISWPSAAVNLEDEVYPLITGAPCR
jgi:hypothetical protein